MGKTNKEKSREQLQEWDLISKDESDQPTALEFEEQPSTSHNIIENTFETVPEENEQPEETEYHVFDMIETEELYCFHNKFQTFS